MFLLVMSSFIVIESPLYKNTCHRKVIPLWKREKKYRIRRLTYHILLRCYRRHDNDPRQLDREGLPSPHIIDYELYLMSSYAHLDLAGLIRNDVIGTFGANRD